MYFSRRASWLRDPLEFFTSYGFLSRFWQHGITKLQTDSHFSFAAAHAPMRSVAEQVIHLICTKKNKYPNKLLVVADEKKHAMYFFLQHMYTPKISIEVFWHRNIRLLAPRSFGKKKGQRTLGLSNLNFFASLLTHTKFASIESGNILHFLRRGAMWRLVTLKFTLLCSDSSQKHRCRS